MKIFILNSNLSKNPSLSTTTWGHHIRRLGGVLVYSIFVCGRQYVCMCLLLRVSLFIRISLNLWFENWKVFPSTEVGNLSCCESFSNNLFLNINTLFPADLLYWSFSLTFWRDIYREDLSWDRSHERSCWAAVSLQGFDSWQMNWSRAKGSVRAHSFK